MRDQVIKSDIHYQEHTGELTHVMSQPTEKSILERNQDLRNSPGVISDLGAKGSGETWGRMVASIPEIIWEQAIRQGYEINSPDAGHAGLEMDRFLKTPIGKTCLVQG